MDKKEIEEYLHKLKKIESELSSDGESLDTGFIGELETVLGSLSKQMMNDPNEKLKNSLFPESVGHFPISNGTMGDGVLIKVKKLSPNAIIPSYAKMGDAGMDLTITREIENTSFSVSYGFGIAMEIPKGYVGLVFPRSSVRNQELLLSNCVGVIDSGYRGEIQATFKKTNGLDSLKYKVGERGAQIIILPYPKIYMTEVPELSETERGAGGFGSTGV
jgi:dUTP pyrophosphatase